MVILYLYYIYIYALDRCFPGIRISLSLFAYDSIGCREIGIKGKRFGSMDIPVSLSNNVLIQSIVRLDNRVCVLMNSNFFQSQKSS